MRHPVAAGLLRSARGDPRPELHGTILTPNSIAGEYFYAMRRVWTRIKKWNKDEKAFRTQMDADKDEFHHEGTKDTKKTSRRLNCLDCLNRLNKAFHPEPFIPPRSQSSLDSARIFY